VVVVRGVVAALEPGYSRFVIADKNSAVIEAGKAPRHDDHFTGSLPRGSHHPGDASRPSLGSFVGVPLGDLVAVPERLRNKGRGTSATSPWRAVLRDPSRLMPSELSRVAGATPGRRCLASKANRSTALLAVVS